MKQEEIGECRLILQELGAVGQSRAVHRTRARIRFNDRARAGGFPALGDRPFRKRYDAAGAFSCEEGIYLPSGPDDLEAFDLYLRKKAYGEFARIRRAFKEHPEWMLQASREQARRLAKRIGQLELLFADLDEEQGPLDGPVARSDDPGSGGGKGLGDLDSPLDSMGPDDDQALQAAEDEQGDPENYPRPEYDFLHREKEHDQWCRKFGIPNGDPTLNPDGTGRDKF